MNFSFVVVADVKSKGKTFAIKTPVVKDFSNYKKSIAVIFFEKESNAAQSIITTIEIIESKVFDLINREVVEYLKVFFISIHKALLSSMKKKSSIFGIRIRRSAVHMPFRNKNKYVVCINTALLRRNNTLKAFLSKSLRIEEKYVKYCVKN